MPRYTIFTTPVVKTILRIISLIILKSLRWKAVRPLPEKNKYIIIVAPHTSNWDVLYGFILAFTLKLDARFLVKKELFPLAIRSDYQMDWRNHHRQIIAQQHCG